MTEHPTACPTCGSADLTPELTRRLTAQSKCNVCGRRCINTRGETLDYVAYLKAVEAGQYCDDCVQPTTRRPLPRFIPRRRHLSDAMRRLGLRSLADESCHLMTDDEGADA